MPRCRMAIKHLIRCLIESEMARPKSTASKFSITLPAGADALLEQLAKRKLYGENKSEVARHLLIAALDALVQNNRLDEPPT